ncbi:hypothetical protein BU14_0087s0025 [Porphyra umbilicalis]|uniref:Uncharacterized protein n=1 Tax=Porphyra umbilicalis TaxID=2786 RepID=A0A1X6PDX7_PORUM|nr:hypothetical protein BU14_0087s0025 [Porphyra umbilicalis]|eukprot:OSX79077.1 hypothetical protein BU14_0087s0025 [Porphyra umbilicalis]
MKPPSADDRAQKLELRRAAVASRNKDQCKTVETSPTDARATARAAMTLASMGGGDVPETDYDDVDEYVPPSPMPTAATRGTKGKRPAATALSSAESAGKVARWKPAPTSAFVVGAETRAGSAAGSVVRAASPDAPMVRTGPTYLVGSAAPGAPAGPSGRRLSTLRPATSLGATADGSTAVAAALGLGPAHGGEIGSTAFGVVRRAPAAEAPAQRPSRVGGPESSVVLGCRRRKHNVPMLRVTELMTGPPTAEARRSAVLDDSAVATPVLPCATVDTADGAASTAASPASPTSRIGAGAVSSPDVGDGSSVPSAGAADSAMDQSAASRPAPRGLPLVGEVESAPVLRMTPRATATTMGRSTVEAPVFRSVNSAAHASAVAPGSGVEANGGATRPTVAAFPDPTGADVQYPTTAAEQATVNPLAAALGTGARGERRAAILENAVWQATRSVRVDVAAMEASIEAMKTTLVSLKAKIDTDIQLSQQNLTKLAMLEKTLLDSLKRAVELGKLGSAATEDDETAEKEKLLKLVTKAYREVLVGDFATAVKTVLAFSSSDDNWDTLVVSVESVQRQGMKKAEEWLNQFIRRSSRRNPTIFANVRISLLALRVKPHLHQMWTELIITEFFKSLGYELKNLTPELAKELLENDDFCLKPRGRKACLDALSNLFMSIGASGRVQQPDGPTGERVVSATLGHFAFVVTKVRNALEVAAGTRSSTRGGAVGDGHFPLWVAEVRRLLPTQASDAAPHLGLVLVDGADPGRALPQL